MQMRLATREDVFVQFVSERKFTECTMYIHSRGMLTVWEHDRSDRADAGTTIKAGWRNVQRCGQRWGSGVELHRPISTALIQSRSHTNFLYYHKKNCGLY